MVSSSNNYDNALIIVSNNYEDKLIYGSKVIQITIKQIYLVLPLGVRVDLGVMAMKNFSRSPESKFYHQMQFSVMPMVQ